MKRQERIECRSSSKKRERGREKREMELAGKKVRQDRNSAGQ